ncbi:MAG: adenosine deaminase [Acidobacteriota bacterium]|nr:adenosine deaminase [Acidobacteriota bacterium]
MQLSEILPGPVTPSFIHSIPKAELHVHLEGSIDAETLRELAGPAGMRETDEWIRERERRAWRYNGLADFLGAFKWVTQRLDSPQAYALAATRLLERLASQNVRYAEITLSAGVILWKKQSIPEIFEAIAEATESFTSRSSLRAVWIFDAIRHFGPDHAREVLGWARIFRDDGVCAFGIGGDEQRGPAELFASIYQEARDLGLHTTAHAGESCGPESVRNAIETLGAERIGHGLAAARDPTVMEMLSNRHVALEICLTSNIRTGAIKSLQDHPFRQFLDAGIEVTLNTDDPALFGTSLENEFAVAAASFGLTRAEIVRLARNAITASFMPGAEKHKIAAELDRCLRQNGD